MLISDKVIGCVKIEKLSEFLELKFHCWRNDQKDERDFFHVLFPWVRMNMAPILLKEVDKSRIRQLLIVGLFVKVVKCCLRNTEIVDGEMLDVPLIKLFG